MTDDATVDSDVRHEVYRFFTSEGRPPMPAEIAANLQIPQSEIEASIGRLGEAHVLVLAPGTPYIWMANPLSALPTPYQVHAAGRDWFGNCIWDALGVVAMLGGDGAVHTWCRDCGERLAVEVSGNEVVRGDGVVHFAIPAAHWWDDIGFN